MYKVNLNNILKKYHSSIKPQKDFYHKVFRTFIILAIKLALKSERKTYFFSTGKAHSIAKRHQNGEVALSSQHKTREDMHDARSLGGSMLDDVAQLYDFIVFVQKILSSSICLSSTSGYISHFPLPLFVSPCYMVFPLWLQLC